MSKQNHRNTLHAAAAEGTLVRLARTIESGHVSGYVVEVGPELFLMCVVSDLILFDGFQAFRLDDLERVWNPAPHRAFVERALTLRGQERPAAPGVDLANLKALLTSAAGRFPLLTIYREHVEPDSCHIGRVVIVSDRTVTLREISPDATWDQDTEAYALQEITRVDFGGLYEDALALVNRAT